VSGTLWIVPTPIGNLEDITLRALRILGEVDLVAAEDTRAAQHLLTHHRISKPTISFFEGNEAARSEELVRRLGAGENVALVSEAGMPGVSDPGQRLVARAVEAGVPVVVLPGPSAALTALVGSGLPTDAFLFSGFLPRAEGARREAIGRLRAATATLIFYEAPGRTADTLADLAAGLGDSRRACLARELTKIHEELVRGTLGELVRQFAAAPPRGEVTLVVEGASEAPPEIDLEAEVRRRIAAGESPKEIAAALSLQTGKPRRQLYQLALALRGPDHD
jgi:16S rRNA (cytidine1402-2'-O)-methyltransferase